MAEVIFVENLDIAGYADVLNANMLPTIVAPVFRLKTGEGWALLPPYSFNAGLLVGAAKIPASELEDLQVAREITLFTQSFAAVRGFDLWVDQSFEPRYEPRSEAREKLDKIASDAMAKAEVALRSGDLEAAEEFSGIAISANDRKPEPLALKAAIRRIQGNSAGERLFVGLAAPLLAERWFSLMTDGFAALRQDVVPRPARTDGRRPMRDMAATRRRAA